MKNVKSIKSTKPSTSNLHAFRVIVRGTMKRGKKEVRIRRVLTTPAADAGAAALTAEKRASEKLRNLSNVYVSVLPPLLLSKKAA